MKALVLLAQPQRLLRQLAPRLEHELHWRGFDVVTADAGGVSDVTPFDVVVLVVGAVVVPRVRTFPLGDIDGLLAALGPLDGRPLATLLVSATGARGSTRVLTDVIERHGGVPLPEIHVSPLGGHGLVDLAAECMTRVPPLRRGLHSST